MMKQLIMKIIAVKGPHKKLPKQFSAHRQRVEQHFLLFQNDYTTEKDKNDHMETEQCCLMGSMPPMMVGKYNEIVIQLGWLLFFAPSFPAGPLFCQLNCLISVWDELTQMSEFKRRDKP